MKTYNYRYKISHPAVSPWVEALRKQLGLAYYVPLTDRQRLALERDVLDVLREHGKLPQDSLVSAEDLQPRPYRRLW